MTAYYNEIEPFAADWLENLIREGHIADGIVDRRSIIDVEPADLRGFTQCHFFAGIGGWSLALRLAGWPDDRPVWTGSCPCQPFSAAGKQRGSNDDRHLWPAWFRLIEECRPGTVFGEQVAGAAGRAWLDHVLADLEGRDYAAAAAVIPAGAVGAPHRRERMWFVAHAADGDGRAGIAAEEAGTGANGIGWRRFAGSGADGRMADAEHAERWPLSLDRQDGRDRPHGGRQETHGELGTCGEVRLLADDDAEGCGRQSAAWIRGRDASGHDADRCGAACLLGHADDARLEGRRDDAGKHAGQLPARAASPWRDLEWLACSDGKARPTQPGLFPLAHGVPNRVGRLRAYGNAIVPQVAAEFIAAYCEC